MDKFREMKGKRFLCFLFAFSITNAIVIWITLTSRDFFSVYEAILMPFKSYANVLSGNRRIFVENIENIIMFVPFGFLAPQLFKTRTKRVIIAGFFFSLCIEILQITFGLGTFEVDDLINNTLGAFIGAETARYMHIKTYIYDKRATILLVGLITASLICLVNTGKIMYRSIHRDRMSEFAALSDDGGMKNLLVLDGKDGYAFGTQMYIEYQNDGTISIAGYSDRRTWYLLGEQTIAPGSYIFKGLLGVNKDTIAIELEYFDADAGTFLRLTPDVGPIDSAQFELDKPTVIRCYVGIYPVGDRCVNARPALFKLGD